MAKPFSAVTSEAFAHGHFLAIVETYEFLHTTKII
jgi:hypothetical protein